MKLTINVNLAFRNVTSQIRNWMCYICIRKCSQYAIGFPYNSKSKIHIWQSFEQPQQLDGSQRNTVIRHSENGYLRDGAVSSLDSSSALVDGRQVGVHVAGEASSPRHLFACSRHLTQRLRVRGHVCQYHQNVLLTLIREELCRRQRESGGYYSLDPGEYRCESHQKTKEIIVTSSKLKKLTGSSVKNKIIK